MGRSKSQFDPDTCTRAVQEIQPMTSHHSLNIFDVRFLRPSKKAEERMHNGCHPGSLAPFVHGNLFPELLKAVKSNVIDAMQEPENRQITLCFVSDSGRHRSVSAGKILAEIVLESPAMQLGQVIFATDQARDGSCAVCARCQFWTYRWKQRNDAVAKAVDLWQTF